MGRLIAVGLLLLPLSAAHSGEYDVQWERKINSLLESQIKAQFEGFKRQILFTKGLTLSTHELDFIKMLYYNKAYVSFGCTKAVLQSKFDSDPGTINWPNLETSMALLFAACISERRAKLNVFNKMIKYYSTISSETLIQCERLSRLFEEEVNFQPYSFLAGEMTVLLDLEKFDSCVISSTH
jgi:hypothetical protein